MEKAKPSSNAPQMKAVVPKHNMTVVELSTPHMKLPGVQKYTHEDLKLMVEKAKNQPQVQEGFYLEVQNYDFTVDEWELETGNSQPHSDESKLNLRPKTAALTAAERRSEQAKKSKELREQMSKKLDGDRNPTFTRPSTAVAKKKAPLGEANTTAKKEKGIVEKQEEVESENEEEEHEQQQEEEQEEESVKQQQVKVKQPSKQNDKKKVTLKEEDIYDLDCEGDEEEAKNAELDDSFEKMSVSQHASYLDNSRMSQQEEKQGRSKQQETKKNNTNQQTVKGKPRQFKSDIANMMSSMFSEISGFDTDI